MAEFPAVLNLERLDGRNGFRLDGAAYDQSGVSVSSAGDVNGDGFDDIIIGAVGADPNGRYSGSSYVVFGRADGFAPSLNLSSLDGRNGFRLDGAAAYDYSGRSVSSAGDVNGDGFDDIIVGAFRADPSGPYGGDGSSYVVFGGADGFAPSLNLADLDGTNGFRLDGAELGDYSGRSVSSAGDVNGDGFDDILVGAYLALPNGLFSGSSYVVFGRAGGFAPSLNLGSLDGTNGFRLDGTAARDYTGRSVSSAGDVNGDGFDDIIVGAGYAERYNDGGSSSSYVMFGRADGFAPSLNLADLDGTNGFRLDGAAGDRSGVSVSSAGDVNGDGFDDIIVGTHHADPNGGVSGASYVVFGRAGGFAPSLNLGSLDGTNGFRLDGAANFRIGSSVSSAGDVNGDGFDDLIVGARHADTNGPYSGSSYVVFGRADGFAPSLNLADLDGTNGFRLDGVAAGDESGISVSSAGDVDGDGFDDIIIGADGADPNGGGSGASYVVFGRAPVAAVTRTGTEAANTIRGGAFNDRLIGLGGDDMLVGGAGNDALVGGAGADTLVGGDGIDTAVYAGSAEGVLVHLGFGIAQGGDAQGDTLTGIENIQGSAFDDTLGGDDGANNLFGLDGDDTLEGGGGADRLDGGLGADGMSGGAGDDRFFVDDAGDRVREFDGEGSDTVFVAAAAWTLEEGSAVEFLRVNAATGISLTGNELDQFIYGAGGNDRLDGGGGSDRLYGGAGDDTYVIGAGSRTVVIESPDAGTDTVEAGISFTLRTNVENLTLTGTGDLRGNGNAGANVITGNAGANILSGGAGDDVLTGGLGADRLTGGLGADTFVFRSVSDSTTSASDLILDFDQAEGDRIDLTQIDADLGLAGDQAFAFIGASAFSGTAGELQAMRFGGSLRVQGDVDGDGAADFALVLRGLSEIGADGFLL